MIDMLIMIICYTHILGCGIPRIVYTSRLTADILREIENYMLIITSLKET